MLQTEILSFGNLSPQQLHAIYYLRTQVFVVEQNCPYQEVDETDLLALHLQMIQNNHLLAYARIIPPSPDHAYTKIGRVVVAPKERGKQLGRILMQTAIAYCFKQWPDSDIIISAQAHLQVFYQSMQFETESEMYLEDDIPHVQMRLTFRKFSS